jgi:membrane protein CcdC involved in cytochrome C biogenesis
MTHPSTLQTLIPIAIILVVLAIRMRSITRERPLKLEQLWIVPGIYLLITGFFFFGRPPGTTGWALSAAAFAVGAVLGWQRGRLMHISVDPETHVLRQKGSLTAMFFLLGLIAVRYGLREAALFHVGGVNIDVNLATEMLMALALGLLSLQRIEMYLRARRLLDEARGARSA